MSFFKKDLSIDLAVPRFSCDIQDHLVAAFKLSVGSCGT